MGTSHQVPPYTPPEVPIFQIHGRHDHVIPVDRVDADQIIPNGGHLISLTHPTEVNDFLGCAVKTVKIPTVYHLSRPM